MRQTVVRGIDAALEARLRAEAKRRGLSLNRTILLLLRQATGLIRPETPESGPPRLHNDLDHLAGTWSSAEAGAFDRRVRDLRRPDEELWK